MAPKYGLVSIFCFVTIQAFFVYGRWTHQDDGALLHFTLFLNFWLTLIGIFVAIIGMIKNEKPMFFMCAGFLLNVGWVLWVLL